jgi:hypothetical protein
MRCYALSITILVIALQSSASGGQETSSPDENQTAPKVGPALRPYSVEPESHKLRAQINGTVKVGGRLNLEASLSEESGTVNSCHWISPEGNVYKVEQESVTSDEGIVKLT